MTTTGRRYGWDGGGTRACRWSLWLALCGMGALCGWSLNAQVAKTLSWNASATAAGYRVYSSTGTDPFAMVNDTPNLTVPVTVSTNAVTRFYVTAYNAAGESGSSEVLTNTPPPPPGPVGPVITMVPPGLSTTNLTVGATVNISALIQNTGDTAFNAVDGALTLLPPGATRDNGPYIHVTVITPPFVVNAKSTRSVAGTWTATTNDALGIYTAYLVIKSDAGVWTASPYSYFQVVATPTPTPPAAPSGLKLTQVTNGRVDVSWTLGTLASATEVWRSERTSAFKRIATTGTGASHYSDTSIGRRRKYAYKVRATNADGTSAFGETVSINTT